MMDTEDAWFYYRDEAHKQIGLAMVMRTTEIVCSTLKLKLGQTWESYDRVAKAVLDQSLSHLFETQKL